MKNYKVQNVVSNERICIKSDVIVRTENMVEHNKPDLMIHDFRTKEITLIEVGITNKNILKEVDVEKGRKYDYLTNDLRLMYPGTTKIIPIVLTWDGLVTHQFHRHARALEMKKNIQAYIQSTVLKNNTCESVLFDFRNKLSEGG